MGEYVGNSAARQFNMTKIIVLETIVLTSARGSDSPSAIKKVIANGESLPLNIGVELWFFVCAISRLTAVCFIRETVVSL